MKPLWSLVLLLAVTNPPPGSAQRSPVDPAAAVSLLRSGSVIRITFPDGQGVTGRYVPAGDGRLGIRPQEDRTDTLRLDAIRSLAVRGRHTGTGAIIGGIAGAGFGVFVGLMSNGLCEGGDDCQGASPYLIAIPLFAGGGALLGAALGTAFPKWRRVFP